MSATEASGNGPDTRSLVSYMPLASWPSSFAGLSVALPVLSQARNLAVKFNNSDLHACGSVAPALNHTPRAPLVTVCAPLLNPPRNVA